MPSINKLHVAALLCALAFAAVARASPPGTPKGWGLAGSAPHQYRVGTESGIGFLASGAKSPQGFGTLSQIFDAKKYHGHRLRLTAEIRSEEVVNQALMWLRVDGCNRKESLAFDNMNERPIKGTTDWQSYEIVLDVPKEATAIAFGVILRGSGKVFFDNFRFESVAQTVVPERRKLALGPSNLDFSK